MDYGDRIFNLLQQCNKQSHVPDLHSFVADIKDGTVFVDCRGFEIFIETHKSGVREQWTGTTIAAANRLEKLGIELETVKI